jgi:hypothetical protein
MIAKSINIISNYFIVSKGLQKLSQTMSLIGIKASPSFVCNWSAFETL